MQVKSIGSHDHWNGCQISRGVFTIFFARVFFITSLKNYFSGRWEVERHFVKQGCTTRCTQLPPSFPTIPQQCHEVLFWNSFRQTCPSSVKQTTKTIIGNRLVESRFRWSVWWCVPKMRSKMVCRVEKLENGFLSCLWWNVEQRFVSCTPIKSRCGIVGNEGGSWVHRVVHPCLTKWHLKTLVKI